MNDKYKNNPALKAAVYDNHKRWLEDHAQEVAEHDHKFRTILKAIQSATGIDIHFVEVDNFKGNHKIGAILAAALNDPAYSEEARLEIATRLAVVDPKPHARLLIESVQKLQPQPSVSLDIIMQNVEKYANPSDASALRSLLESNISSSFLLPAYLKTQKETTAQTINAIVIALNSEVMVEEALGQIAKRGLKDDAQIKAILKALSENDPLKLNDKFVMLGGNKRYTGKEQIDRIRKAIKRL